MDADHPQPFKRRRIERACDECRRLKIKCDGLARCRHCGTYDRTCTYNIPTRRPKSLAQHAKKLEDRFQTIQQLLQALHPGIDIDDPRLEPARIISGNLRTADSTINSDNVAATERYHIERVPSSRLLEVSSLPASTRQNKPRINSAILLPSKNVAHGLLTYALQDACVLHRFVHESLLYTIVDYIYKTSTEQLIKDHRNSLALFYAALALGTYFAPDGTKTGANQRTGDVTDRSSYFNWSLRFLNLDECQDLVSLQALCFLVLFLQSSGQLERCYSYAGIALRSAVALGLHRRSDDVLDPIEHETKKRLFWVIWRMDIYSSSMLGTPPMLSPELINQDFPQPTDNVSNTGHSISLDPTEKKLLLVGANEHTRLTLIMSKVMSHVKALKKGMSSSADNPQNLMHGSKMDQIEQELQTWLQNLPSELLPGDKATAQLERVRQLLRIAYAYVQMVLYEPLSRRMSKQNVFMDPQFLDYISKYISATRNIVTTGVLIHKTNVANFCSRSTMISTVYSAILSLFVFLLNSSVPSGLKGVVFKEALKGRETLEDLSSKSKFANQYVGKLNIILEMFQNRPQPLPASGPASSNISISVESAGRTEPRADTQTRETHSQQLMVTARDSDEHFLIPQVTTAPECCGSQTVASNVQSHDFWGSGTAPYAEFTPSHSSLVFENPYQVTPSYAFDDANTQPSAFQPAASDIDYQIHGLVGPDSELFPAQNVNWVSKQDGLTDFPLLEANVATSRGSQILTSNPPFPEYWTLIPSLPRGTMGLNSPTSVAGPFAGMPEPALQTAALLPGRDYGGSMYEVVEPMPEQIWDSTVVAEMCEWT